ncbi:MAG: hypothetical protein H7175_16220 [Burkholderiales bacterium]|nr:hypothetical protein [Anaerolineae bacterium]
MITRLRKTVPALAAALLILSAALAQAASNGSISFDGTGDSTPPNCDAVNLFYDFSWLGDIDDGGGTDRTAIIMADADGNILDNDFLAAALGPIAGSDQTTFAAVESIAARPVTIALFDIGDIGLLEEHSAAGIAFTTSGILLDEDVFDPGTFTTNNTCELLPLKEPFSFADGGADSSPNAFFEPGDDRINRQAYAYAAIYCDADLQGVNIYGINSTGAGSINNGRGFKAIFVPYAELPATPSAEDGNLLIEQFENISFYRLTSGEYQVNVGPDFEGKQYVLVWDGCPQTTIQAYIFWNGVMMPTEIFPRS